MAPTAPKRWNQLQDQFWSQSFSPLNKAIVAVFEERGVTEEVCADFLAQALKSKNSRFALFNKGKMLMKNSGKGWSLIWLDSTQVTDLKLRFSEIERHNPDVTEETLLNTTAVVLLGQEHPQAEKPNLVIDSIKGSTFFCLNASKIDEKSLAPLTKPNSSTTEIRYVHPRELLTEGAHENPLEELAIIGQSVSRLSWHNENIYSPRTGTRLFSAALGHRLRTLKTKTHPKSFSVYPRIDPCAIVLVVNLENDQCLLAERAGRYAMGFFSCMAGFVEQGESVEDAVRREVFEESGVNVSQVQIVGSQAWPIGAAGHSELMLGCLATVASENEAIALDENELARACWFTKPQIEKMLENSKSASLIKSKIAKKDETKIKERDELQQKFANYRTQVAQEEIEKLVVPPKTAIAHHLIKLWAEGSKM